MFLTRLLCPLTACLITFRYIWIVCTFNVSVRFRLLIACGAIRLSGTRRAPRVQTPTATGCQVRTFFRASSRIVAHVVTNTSLRGTQSALAQETRLRRRRPAPAVRRRRAEAAAVWLRGSRVRHIPAGSRSPTSASSGLSVVRSVDAGMLSTRTLNMATFFPSLDYSPFLHANIHVPI